MKLKFSIITPSFNSGDTLERAIQSVLAQEYEFFEHIIVDGGSTDGTLEILERYPHLRWISEFDEGQVDAMNKGFALAGGDIVGYLNADDYYLEGTFSVAAEAFDDPEIKMVMGKIRVYAEEYDRWWENDPAADFDRMLRHWEKNAFCVNPVGYFYRKEVQEEIHLNSDNDDKQDLEFLLEVADRFPGGIRKLDRVFGEFINGLNTKTTQEQHRLDYWRPDNFSFLDRFLEKRSPEYQEEFRARQACGYQVRTNWTIQKAIKQGRADKDYEDGKLFYLPADVPDIDSHKAFAENLYPVTEGDTIVAMLCPGKVASQSIVHSLKQVPSTIYKCPSYHLHLFDDTSENVEEDLILGKRLGLNNKISGHALRCVWNKHKDRFIWKFVAGVRDPVSQLISLQYWTFPNSYIVSLSQFRKEVIERWGWIATHFDRYYKDIIGLDVYDFPFDKEKGYTIVKKGNVEVLLYTLENLNEIVKEAMLRFLGIHDFQLISINQTKYEPYYDRFKRTISILEGSLSEDDLNPLYTHKIATHFYSEDEICRFRKRWGNSS